MNSEKPLQILFPMGGLGTRFANIGITTPKPLIEVDGMPMIVKALSSFQNLKCRKRYLFIIRAEHAAEHKLDDLIRSVVPDAEIQLLHRNTGGAVETCLEAKPLIDPAAPIVVMDCDLYFRSAAYEAVIEKFLADDSSVAGVEGLLLFFTSKAPRYSYAELDENGLVTRTAEKVPISNNALIGAYGFRFGKTFLDAGEELCKQQLDADAGRKEYYLSLLYNILLQRGAKVLAVPRDDYASFGTPDELENYTQGRPSYVTE